MQKTLRKPTNWQDFENLCKKLWGEIWQIPYKIKKNGRLGQPQNGVDVYGIPKGEDSYWGIQCKGKDDYTNAKLTEKEIDQEIEKAKSFLPELKTFIIATTQNKDVSIEEYVRRIDLESRKNGGFEIILFCWEDITDFIEENRETINWYLKENNYREKFEVFVGFKEEKEKTQIQPKYLEEITKYKVGKTEMNRARMLIDPIAFQNPFGPSDVNRSWCSIEIIIKNIGNVVLENWYINLAVDDNIHKVSDGHYSHYLMSPEIRRVQEENRTLYAFKEDKSFLYEPKDNEPLIQKSSRRFKIKLLPQIGATNFQIAWELLARDFDKSGILTVNINPEIEEKVYWKIVSSENEIQPDKKEIKYLIEKVN